MFETDDHRDLRRQARDFAHAEIAPHAARLDAHPGRVETEIVKAMARPGWLTAAVPAARGGAGLGHVAKLVLLEEISQASPAMGAALQASQLGAEMFLHYGSDELLAEWMPQFSLGERLATIAVTETESGGHVLGMRATGHRDGDRWILNGRKTFIGNSHLADVFGVVVRTAPDSGRSSRSLSAFAVETKRAGVRLAPYAPARGLHGFSFGDVIFEDVAVPAAHMIGAEGEGMHVAYAASILAGRLCLAGLGIGIQHALKHDTITYTTHCHRYGGALSDLPVIQQRIGWITARLMRSRTAAYTAAHLLDHGQGRDIDLIHAKLEASEAALDSAGDAMRAHGAARMRTDRRVGQLAQDAWCVEAAAGTSDIQLLKLAQDATGNGHLPYSVRLADRVALPPPPAPPSKTAREHAA
ncbi:acyl-CoA dehydrogenase family protein [Actinomadura syzygii]|uniref:Acyl-CoA dehydrogenase n=1 Tax=Actinomadura syzygii TaxID=1427538 RepID=A0A5D0TSB0_9ACTN|nr:acyl-CoA dehydrogenase family protein [Actinomadura syzygii]TYC08654.1 acyl-CoA dehydrogenase [Actinomadura syzygii]